MSMSTEPSTSRGVPPTPSSKSEGPLPAPDSKSNGPPPAPASTSREPESIAKPAPTPLATTIDGDDDSMCLFAVLCPSDTTSWSKLTCVLCFVASFVCDGVCASLFLLDARFGMGDMLPQQARTIEHLAVILLVRFSIDPFSCAYINWYGFRHCLFVGSVFSITWISLLCLVENALFHQHYYCFGFAVVGGIGMGMIKTSFSVLLSSLFILNRRTAHLTDHLGSLFGMLFVPPLTEFVILKHDWHAALYLHFGLMCITISFWLFVATPWPFKIQVVGKDLSSKYSCGQMMRSQARTTRDVENLRRKKRFPTLQNIIGEYGELRMELLTNTTSLSDNNKRLLRVERKMRHITWLYEKQEYRRTCIQNVTNLFDGRCMVGSRPMYRDDIFFNGNIFTLKKELKFSEYIDYLMATTRVFTVADLNEEKQELCCVIWPTAISRVLKSMFDLSIFCDTKFLVLITSEALVHASCFIPFIFIKGPLGQKSSPEAIITLIAGCVGLLYGRGFGHWLHKTSSDVVPPAYHVSLVLITNGLAILLCATDDFGYYKSIQNAPIYAVFPLKTFNNMHGYISVVRGLSSFLGILYALKMILQTTNGLLPKNNRGVYFFAGMLMMAGGVCVCLLQRSSSATDGKRLNRGRDRHYFEL